MTSGNAVAHAPSTRVHIPEHVVYRSFVVETVVLNLQTGTYHGLNVTAGRMLELLDTGRTIVEAAVYLAEEYSQPVEQVERDCFELCSQLAERGLVELRQAAA